MTTRSPVVAIDGPAGAGKSTVARLVAQRLGFVLLDTGALYRAVALAAQRAGIAWEDENAVTATARRLVSNDELQLLPGTLENEQSVGGSGVQVLLAGQDVSKAIRAPDISQGASQISAIGTVREALLDLQRNLGADGGVVVEGRDIGTVVFPKAEVKFFLTASLKARARRRYEELRERGVAVSLEQIEADVQSRDQADQQREVAPLRQADDAILIDSSDQSAQQVVDQLVGVVQGMKENS
jgi:CMP/dCMP kinase